MALTIDQLEIKIVTQAKSATTGIDALAKSLDRLSVAVNKGGLASNLTQIADALGKFSVVGKINLTSKINQLSKLGELIPILGGAGASRMASNLSMISTALTGFSAIPKIPSLTSLASSIKALNDATASMNEARLQQFSLQMQGIASALSHLSMVGKGNISSVVNAVKKIPEITAALDPATIEAFAAVIQKLTAIMTPLAVQMEKIANGFNALSPAVRRSISAINKSSTSVNNLRGAFGGTFSIITRFIAGLWTVYYTVQRITSVFADLYKLSNEYVESLNLFRVSLGETAKAAQTAAEDIGRMMGIDPAEWMQNQGVFQRMATGFGIASDEAEIMSRNLTQLAYDMSSFFNTDVETAMQKLQSGMSGQIKGLKAWGYNLSVAALQETALSLGIDQSVRSMTEAQKAQLRYITLIQKSKGVMGDMAKTINTPANALRILEAQLTLLKRSLGDIISTLVTKWIPYVQAFVELLREAAQTLAASWGFKIEELPTNNLEMAEELIDGIGDDVEDTEDALAGLKKQLAGFDELNILKSGDGSAKTDEILNSLNIALPDYNFTENLDESTRNRIEEIKGKLTALKGVMEALIPIAMGLTAAFAFDILWKGAAAFIGLFTGDLKILSNSFIKTKKAGESFGASMKKSMKSLSNWLVVITGAVTIFATMQENIGGLVDGSKKWGEVLLATIPTLAIFGVAMYSAMGPVGLVVGALAALAGAIVGAEKAHAEMRKEMVKATFYGKYGTDVSVLADAFSELANATVEAFDGIMAHQENIDSARENIKKTTQTVDELVLGVENSAISIEEAVPRIADAFKTLYDDSKKYLTGTRDLIISSLSGSIVDVEASLKEEVLAATGALTEQAVSALDALNAQKTQLDVQLEAGTIDAGTYTQGLAEIMEQISKITGVSDEHTSAIENAGADFNQAIQDAMSGELTWTDDYSSVFANIAESADVAKDQITTAYDAIIEAYEEQARLARELGNAEQASLFEQMAALFGDQKNADLAKVDSQLTATINALQEDLYQKLGTVFDAASADYEGKSGWYKFWHSKATYITKALADYRDGELADVIASIKEKFNLSDDELWLDDAVGKALDTYVSSLSNVSSTESWETGLGDKDFSKILTDTFNDLGISTTDGLAEGITEGQEDVNEAIGGVATGVIDAYKETLGIHSPSREMQLLGQYTIQGLAIGLSDTSALSLAIDNIVGQFDILSRLKNAWSKVCDWWKNISLPDVSFKAPNMGDYSYNGGASVVSRIASKNNSGVIQGITSGVYNAMMAAQDDGNSNEGGTSRIVVQIGDQAVGEASVRYINGRIVQTGASPIYS